MQLNKTVFSIVIPVFNRAWCVQRAIKSAVDFSETVGNSEIIIVDDGSTDGSLAAIKVITDEVSRTSKISIKLVLHSKNKGVCAAKNTGALNAMGEWVIFLDSDDQLISGSAGKVHAALKAQEKFPLHFFKCIGEDATLIPDDLSPLHVERNLNEFLLYGTNGEALPIVRTEVFKNYLYDEDVRGYESLAYLRIIKTYSCCVLNSIVARRYYTGHEDRLSSKRGMKLRYKDIANGHLRILKEHWGHMSVIARVAQCLRYLKAVILLNFS